MPLTEHDERTDKYLS